MTPPSPLWDLFWFRKTTGGWFYCQGWAAALEEIGYETMLFERKGAGLWLVVVAIRRDAPIFGRRALPAAKPAPGRSVVRRRPVRVGEGRADE